MSKILSFLRSNPFVSAACLLCIICFIVICNPSGLYFLCDDFAHIPQSGKGNFFQTYLLRPVPACTLWLDVKLWHLNAEGFHTTNIVLHVVNSCLVFLLVRELQMRYFGTLTPRRFSALLTALLFLSYAFHSEPVFWIVGRGGALAALFVQASLLFYFKEKTGYLVLGLCAFVIGLFTYELTWIVPLLVTAFYLYEVHYQKRKKSFLPVILFWAVLAAYLILRYFILKNSLNGYEAGNAIHRNYFSLLYNYAVLAGRLFLPPMESSRLFLLFFMIGGCVFSGLLFLIYKRSEEQFAFFLLILSCMLISLLPVVSLGIDTHDTESERFIYPASVFACLLIVFGGSSLVKKAPYFFGYMILVLGCHLFLFYKAATAYRYASYVSRFTIESLNAVPGIQKITFTNLPTQYKGALLFRIGFPKWAPGMLSSTYDSIEIRSFKEMTERKPLTRITAKAEIEPRHLYVDFMNDTLKLH